MGNSSFCDRETVYEKSVKIETEKKNSGRSEKKYLYRGLGNDHSIWRTVDSYWSRSISTVSKHPDVNYLPRPYTNKYLNILYWKQVLKGTANGFVEENATLLAIFHIAYAFTLTHIFQIRKNIPSYTHTCSRSIIFFGV